MYLLISLTALLVCVNANVNDVQSSTPVHTITTPTSVPVIKSEQTDARTSAFSDTKTTNNEETTVQSLKSTTAKETTTLKSIATTEALIGDLESVKEFIDILHHIKHNPDNSTMRTPEITTEKKLNGDLATKAPLSEETTSTTKKSITTSQALIGDLESLKEFMDILHHNENNATTIKPGETEKITGKTLLGELATNEPLLASTTKPVKTIFTNAETSTTSLTEESRPATKAETKTTTTEMTSTESETATTETLNVNTETTTKKALIGDKESVGKFLESLHPTKVDSTTQFQNKGSQPDPDLLPPQEFIKRLDAIHPHPHDSDHEHAHGEDDHSHSKSLHPHLDAALDAKYSSVAKKLKDEFKGISTDKLVIVVCIISGILFVFVILFIVGKRIKRKAFIKAYEKEEKVKAEVNKSKNIDKQSVHFETNQNGFSDVTFMGIPTNNEIWKEISNLPETSPAVFSESAKF